MTKQNIFYTNLLKFNATKKLTQSLYYCRRFTSKNIDCLKMGQTIFFVKR